MIILGKGNKQTLYSGDTLPSHLLDWFIMMEKKPRILGHTYDAQSDGTWLDITTQEVLDDLTGDAVDAPTIEEKYNNILGVLEGLPVPTDVAFMLMYIEIQEYHTHGTTGNLLTGMVDTSGMTVVQISTYLSPFFQDMKTSLGKMIGRRI